MPLLDTVLLSSVIHLPAARIGLSTVNVLPTVSVSTTSYVE